MQESLTNFYILYGLPTCKFGSRLEDRSVLTICRSQTIPTSKMLLVQFDCDPSEFSKVAIAKKFERDSSGFFLLVL